MNVFQYKEKHHGHNSEAKPDYFFGEHCGLSYSKTRQYFARNTGKIEMVLGRKGFGLTRKTEKVVMVLPPK